MALTSIQLTHAVEKAIRAHLTDLRRTQVNYEVQPLSIYSFIASEFPDQCVTSGFFNKILADMRGTGIITVRKPCTGKSGLPPYSVVSISNMAWEMETSVGGVK